MKYHNVDDFKKWMKEQKDFNPEPIKNKLIGLLVESKIKSKRLMSRIEPQEGDSEDLVVEFKKEGGKIIDVEGKKFLIEVDSGSFFIPRQYVKHQD